MVVLDLFPCLGGAYPLSEPGLILNNHIIGNEKFLTTHISQCMFWEGEPSD